MSKIKILSEHLANQIAAGEVVERPASVVKELLENSIDAEARQVQVEIEGSGTKLIKVIDDGVGMDPDDILLCLERHATSKLRENTGDGTGLSAIRSLGFRGEAIPSIASVAKMSLTSRTENEPLGTQVEVSYGKVMKIHETGCNKGTLIEVRNLFGNMPARKKFLKSSRTELFHIEEVIKNYALANYRLGLTYRVNNNTILDFSASAESLEGRIRMLYAKNTTIPLISLTNLEHTFSADDSITVEGLLLSPEQSFGATSRLRLFVNGRAVKDRMMTHAVSEGLSGYLMKGRIPAGALFVTVPFEEVDVNVHPTKQEVRFQQPNRIHEKIVAVVRLGMENHQHSTRQTIFGSREQKGREAIPVSAEKTKSGISKPHRIWKTSTDISFLKDSDPGLKSTRIEPGPKDTSYTFDENRDILATAEPDTPFFQNKMAKVPTPESLRPIGQIMDLYLLCEANSGEEKYLVVIDQHAVHERILFENLKKQFTARQMASQSLLFPKMVELPPEYTTILEKNSEQLEQLGLTIEEFGGNSFIIKTVPAVISHLDPEEILSGILSGFAGLDYDRDQGKKRADATRIDDVLSTMACKAAIKSGQNLNAQEMQELLKLMQDSNAFTHCPHGRPVIRMFSAAEIKKWFHRT
ncbi:MAG: DNA mismatch repair endonuclease MutL [Desulfobulbales bacterium]